MNFNNSFTIQDLVTDANKKFKELQTRLNKIDDRLRTCMNGKTRVGLIFAIIFTLVWGGIFGYFHNYIKNMVNPDFLKVSFIASLVLVVVMLIDHAINFKYYGTIMQYQGRLYQLKRQLDMGKNNVSLNKDVFLKSRSNGWRHALEVGESIPEETKKIEESLAGVEALSSGFINGLKNFLYYTVTIVIMIIGSLALFNMASGIITGISGESISESTLQILCIIGFVIAGIIEILLAKLVWGATNCSVTNLTLLIIPAGPILFLLVMTLGTLLVLLVVAVVSILLYLAALAIGAACLCGSISGG